MEVIRTSPPVSTYDEERASEVFRSLCHKYLDLLAKTTGNYIAGLTLDEQATFARLDVTMAFANPMLTRMGRMVCDKAREEIANRQPLISEPADEVQQNRSREYREKEAACAATTDARPFYYYCVTDWGRTEHRIGGPDGFPRLSYPETEAEAREMVNIYNTLYAAGFGAASKLFRAFADDLSTRK